MESRIKSFIGVIGSGKDYQCNKLIREGEWVSTAFAKGLRDMCWKVLGWSPKDDEEYEAFKKGLVNIPNFGYVVGRIMLQNIGSMARTWDEGVFCNAWRDDVLCYLRSGLNVCCSDLRALNELLTSYKMGSNIIFTNYISDRYDCTQTHESERLAQFLIYKGFKDLQVLTKGDIDMIYEEFPKWSDLYQNYVDGNDLEGLKSFRGF
jgi:glutaredoxin-related protein